MTRLFFAATCVSLLVSASALAATAFSSIPRTDNHAYVRQGLYEGGSTAKANLQSIRVAAHKAKKFERWVVDFSDPKTQEVGKTAPKFQLRYYEQKADFSAKGTPTITSPAKFVFLLRAIDKVLLDREDLEELSKKSHVVSEVVMYPPVEEGDMAVELILKKDVSFRPHQPLTREGRLVLDIRLP